MINTTLLVRCECSAELVEIEYDPFTDDYMISLWSRGLYHSNKMTIMERFRWIWKILTTGKPWTDCIVLNREEFDKIRNFKL